MNMKYTLSFCSCFWCTNLKMRLSYQVALLSVQLGYRGILFTELKENYAIEKDTI